MNALGPVSQRWSEMKLLHSNNFWFALMLFGFFVGVSVPSDAESRARLLVQGSIAAICFVTGIIGFVATAMRARR